MAQKTVLIVEDNDLHRRLLNDILYVGGYRVVMTETGAPTVELARREKPSLILLDMQLPDISGIEVIRMLKSMSNTQNIPIVAVTAHAMRGDEQKFIEQGCDAYMSKPINVRDLLILVGILLSRSHARRRGGGGHAGILPPAGSQTRWSARQKAAVVIAIRGGMISLIEASDRYKLSEDEFSEWREAFDRDGIAGLYAKKRPRRSRSKEG